MVWLFRPSRFPTKHLTLLLFPTPSGSRQKPEHKAELRLFLSTLRKINAKLGRVAVMIQTRKEFMFKALIFFAVLFAAHTTFAQNDNSVTLIVQNKDTKSGIADAIATVKGTDISAVADASGRVSLANVPAGEQTIEISSPGYEKAEIKLVFPLSDLSERTILLTIDNEVGEVTITSTRTGRDRGRADAGRGDRRGRDRRKDQHASGQCFDGAAREHGNSGAANIGNI